METYLLTLRFVQCNDGIVIGFMSGEALAPFDMHLLDSDTGWAWDGNDIVLVDGCHCVGVCGKFEWERDT